VTAPVFKSEQVVVYDEVLAADRFEALFRHLNGLEYESVHARSWRKVWRLHDGMPLTGRASWLAAPGAATSRQPSYPTRTPMDDLVRFIVDRLPDVESIVGEGWQTMSFAPWLYPPGSGLSLHQDGYKYTGAFTYFAHREWRLHWGGHLVVLDPRTRPVGIGAGEMSPPFLDDSAETRRVFDPGLGLTVLPKPNRLVFIAPTALHLLTRVDVNAGQQPRMTVAGFFHRDATASG
jgi:hypothetical protein